MLATQSVAFFFSDAHVAEEGFLELINNMLTSGMVPALYEESEKDGVVGNIRDEAVKNGSLDAKEVWNYLRRAATTCTSCSRCRPSARLRVRCRSFPGMVNNSVIDWFVPWPEQALLSVAGVFLAEEDLPDTMRTPIVKHMVGAQQRALQLGALRGAAQAGTTT